RWLVRCASASRPRLSAASQAATPTQYPPAWRRARAKAEARDAADVAFLAALIAFGSRFASKVLTTALGWASTLLFGRVPASRQILLLGITFGSVIWMVMLAGFIIPDLGAFLLVLIPPQNVVPQNVIRLVMLVGVIV